MAQFDRNGDVRRAQSLLAMASPADDDKRPKGSRSLLNDSVDEEPDDPVARHRLARSRREAAKSPLISALGGTPGTPGAAAAGPVPPVGTPRKDAPASPAASGLGARLFRRKEPASSGAGSETFGTAPLAYEPGAQPEVDPGNQRRTQDLPTYVPAPASADPNAWRPLIDPYKVISGIANAKFLIAAMTIAGALLGVAVALSTPKKFESVAELLVDPRDLRLTDRDITVAGLPSDATLAIVENQVRVLTSGTVLNQVVDELNLTSDPEFNGEGAGGLFSTLTNWRALFARGGIEDDGGARKRAMTIDNLARALSVERGGKTFIVTVGVTTQSPEKSALIANTMTRVFLETSGRIQADTAGRAADELTSRLDELRQGVEEAERKVETFKAENDLIGSQGRLISEDELVTLNNQLSQARARTLELNARAASARALTADAAISGTLPEELTSSVMTELRSQYAALKSESDRLSVKLGPRHPQRVAVDAQVAGARAQIEAELRRIAGSIQVELKRAVQLEQELASRLAQLKVGQGSVNADLVTLRELEREAAAKRAVYESFLLRARETGEQRDINTANISVISQAYPPIMSVGPSRVVTVLTFTIAGFLGGIGVGGARGAWRSIRDDAETRRLNGAAFDAGATPPEPDGAPHGGPGGGRPANAPTATAARAAPHDWQAPLETPRQAANDGGRTMARTSGWLDSFRRKLRQDEAAPNVGTAHRLTQAQVPQAETLYHAPVQPMAPAAASFPHNSHAGQVPASAPAAYAAPEFQPAPIWPAAAAVAPTHSAAPIYGHGTPAYPYPAAAQVPNYPVQATVHQQQAMFHAPAPVAQPVVYPQPAPALAQPATAPQSIPQPMAATPLYQSAAQAFPYAAAAQVPFLPHAVPSQTMPVHAQQAATSWHDDERAYADRGEGHRSHARTVDELRDDLRDFRAAVLDLTESRSRRRYG